MGGPGGRPRGDGGPGWHSGGAWVRSADSAASRSRRRSDLQQRQVSDHSWVRRQVGQRTVLVGFVDAMGLGARSMVFEGRRPRSSTSWVIFYQNVVRRAFVDGRLEVGEHRFELGGVFGVGLE